VTTYHECPHCGRRLALNWPLGIIQECSCEGARAERGEPKCSCAYGRTAGAVVRVRESGRYCVRCGGRKN